MDSFELGRLNDHDFEVVCRDLFSVILGMELELFPRGRDQGIDLRHVDHTGSITIVQCKHWPKSTQRTLIRHLKSKERLKAEQHRPARYVIATSSSLTPAGKQELYEAFQPWIQAPGDIYGIDDIVAQLRIHPEIIERHFRLWLSGTGVLRTVLHQSTHLRSDWLRERIPAIATTFVPHQGFLDAQKTLKQRRVCVLAGIPGAGKTTVAMMLAAWLAGQGFDVYEVSQDIDEVAALWNPDSRQAFLYDDFLGQTTIREGLNKNEESRLLNILRQIRKSPNKALIMTTRDYILNSARIKHEKLDSPDLTASIDVIALSAIGPQLRAEILHNHVHAADIPSTAKHAFAGPSSWWPIIDHRNFNPRLVEETLRLYDGRPADLPKVMAANLDAPRRIWERIVENELSEEELHLLEVLFTFESATEQQLQHSWSKYRVALGTSNDGRAFRRSLKRLDGTMIAIKDGKIRFHNPSINDYLQQHVDLDRARLPELIGAITDPGQLYRLIAAAEAEDAPNLHSQIKALGPQLAAAALEIDGTVETEASDEDDSRTRHLEWLLEVADRFELAALANFVVSRTTREFVLHGYEHTTHLMSLAYTMRSSPLVPREHTETFSRAVGDELEWHLGDMVESGHYGDALDAHSMLKDHDPDRAGDPTVTSGMIATCLRELRETAESGRPELTDDALDVYHLLMALDPGHVLDRSVMACIITGCLQWLHELTSGDEVPRYTLGDLSRAVEFLTEVCDNPDAEPSYLRARAMLQSHQEQSMASRPAPTHDSEARAVRVPDGYSRHELAVIANIMARLANHQSEQAKQQGLANPRS